MMGSKSLQFWFRALGLLAFVIAVTGCAAQMRGMIGAASQEDLTVAQANIKKLDTEKAGKDEVAAVSAAHAETARLQAETAQALAAVKQTVDGHGTAITGLTVRAGKNDEWVAQTVAALEQLRTGKVDKTMVDAGFKNLGSQIAGAKKQLVDVKYITGAGHHDVVAWVDGFERCTYDSAKNEVSAGKLSDAQKKFLDEKVVKVYDDTPFYIKVAKGIASTERFLDKGKPVEPTKNKELNVSCAQLRARMVADYVAAAIKKDVDHVGLGSTDDRGSHAANRSVGVVMTFADNDRVHGVATAPAPPKPAATPPAAPSAPPAPAAPVAPAPAPTRP